MPDAARKSAVLTVRIAPEVKDALRAAALVERRSLANMIEIAILEYYAKHKVRRTKNKVS